MSTSKSELPPYHELFELEEGKTPKEFPPPPNFSAIKMWVKRFGPNGLEECPRPWLLSEIPDRATFFDIFGGGRYEIEGRRLDGTFYARRGLMLVGDPKPLVPKSTQETAPPAAPAAAPGGFSIPGMGGMGDAFAMASGNPMALLILIMMQNADRAEQRAERQAQMSIENMKVIASMFGGQNRPGTDPAVAQAFGHVTDLLRAQIQTNAPQPAAPQRSVEEEFRRAQDLLSLAKKMSPTESPEKFSEILKEIFQIVPPEVLQNAAAAVMGPGNGAAAPPLRVEGVITGSQG